MKNFCTAINCMDGRVQLPVNEYLQKRFNAGYVDAITEPGPNLLLAENADEALVRSILNRLEISVENHKSVGIAVIGHHDCAGNPTSKEDQIGHIRKAIKFIREHYDNLEVIGLWADENFVVSEIPAED